jgi:co-chaperonin GroES (HSP10)
MSDVNVEATLEAAEARGKMLPKPVGYKILCMVPAIEKEYDSGLVKADDTVRVEGQTTVVLFVVELGDLAYNDDKKFPTGPWCKKGDFVITRGYAGTRFQIHGTEFRLINDDTVEGIVDDPRAIRRAGV